MTLTTNPPILHDFQQPRGRLLVVANGEDMLTACQSHFSQEYEVFAALTADNAYHVLSNTPIHVIISDEQLTDARGAELLSRVSMDYPDVVRLLLTCHTDGEAVISAANEGHVFHIISRPWCAGELEAVVHKAFGYYQRIMEQRQQVVQQADDLLLANARLEALNNQLRTVIDAVPDYIFVKDRQGRFVVSNLAHAQSVPNATHTDFIGKTGLELYPPEYGQQFHADDMRVMETGEALINAERQTVGADGSRRQVLTNKVPLKAPDGQIIGLVGISRDITERKKAEAALRESEQRYRLVTENSRDVIWTVDNEFRFTYISPSIRYLRGYEPEEAMQETIEETMTPASFQLVGETIQQGLSAVASGALDDILSFEVEQKHKDGSLVWVEIVTQPILNAERQMVGILGVSRDISKRKQAEQALRQSEQRFRTIVEQFAEGFALIDQHGVISEWNKALETLTGLRRDEVIGASFADMRMRLTASERRTPDQYERVTRIILDALRTKKSFLFERPLEVVVAQGGQKRLVQQTVFPIQLEEEFCIGAVFQDRTEHKQAEESLRRHNAILQALTSISQSFLRSTDVSVALPEALAQLGQAADVSRVHLYENAAEADVTMRANRQYEWVAPGVAPMSHTAERQQFIYARSEAWYEILAADNFVAGLTRNFPDPLRTLLQQAGTESVLTVPIFCSARFWGILVFAECRAERQWQPMEIEAMRNVASVIGSALQLQQSETALAEERNLLRILIDNLPDSVYVKNLQDQYVISNLAHTVALGAIDPAEIIGKTSADFISADQAVQIREGEKKILLSGQAMLDHEQAYHEQRSRRSAWYLTTKVPLRDREGKITGLVGISRDITSRKMIEQALIQSEQFNRAVLSSLSAHLAALDGQGNIIAVNEAWERFARENGAPESVRIGVGLNYFKICANACGPNADESDEALRGIQAVSNGSLTEFSLEYPCHSPTKQRWFLMRVTPLSQAPGSIVVSHTDITERKQAEAAEREQRILAEALRDSTATLASTLDPRAVMDRILENLDRVVPHSFASILLIEGDSAYPAYFRNWPAMDEAQFRNSSLPLDTPNLREMMLTRAPVLIADTTTATNWLAIVPSVRSYLGVPIRARGQVIGFLEVGGITPRFFTSEHAERLRVFADQAAIAIENAQLYDELQKRARQLEERVRERTLEFKRAKEHVEAILNNGSDAIIVTTRDGSVLQANPVLRRLFGYQPEDILSQSLLLLAEPTYAGALDEALRIVIANARSLRIEMSVRRKDGSIFDADVALSPILEGGDSPEPAAVSGMVCSVRDITERKQAEETLRRAKESAEAANQAKSIFLANMSHEIRTPMNAILGFSQWMLRDPSTTKQQRQHLDTINRSGEHLLTLINNILELSKIEAGRTTLNPVSFDLYALISDLEMLFRMRTEAKNVQFVVERLGAVPRFVTADQVKLRAILINLLGNSVKFTREGAIRLRLYAEQEVGPQCRLHVEVEDTGPGIAEEEMSRLFQPFEQTQAGRAAGTGTGLGLAICREFVHLMGGNITAISRAGTGSLFKFDLPLESADPETIVKEPELRRAVRLQPDQPIYRVLVADDNQDNRLLLSHMLRAIGFLVRQVADGQEALTTFESWQPHLIFMDLRMPVMDGSEAIRRIRASAGGQQVKIIVLSASAFEEDRQASLSMGSDAFLSKPFRDSELLELAGRLLGAQYVYADQSAATAEVPEMPETLAPQAVAALPAELVGHIRQSALKGDFDHVIELLDQVSSHDARLAQHLRNLAERFDSERLLKLLA